MNRVPPDCGIGVQILLPNESALLGHLASDGFGHPTAIKPRPAFVRDRLQGFGQIRLTPRLARFVRLAAGAKLCQRRRPMAKFWQQFLDATR